MILSSALCKLPVERPTASEQLLAPLMTPGGQRRVYAIQPMAVCACAWRTGLLSEDFFFFSVSATLSPTLPLLLNSGDANV